MFRNVFIRDGGIGDSVRLGIRAFPSGFRSGGIEFARSSGVVRLQPQESGCGVSHLIEGRSLAWRSGPMKRHGGFLACMQGHRFMCRASGFRVIARRDHFQSKQQVKRSAPSRLARGEAHSQEGHWQPHRTSRRSGGSHSQGDPQCPVRREPVQTAFAMHRSLPHGHVAAILGTLKQPGPERIPGQEDSCVRRLAIRGIAVRVSHPLSKSAAVRIPSPETGDTSPGDRLCPEPVSGSEVADMLDRLQKHQ